MLIDELLEQKLKELSPVIERRGGTLAVDFGAPASPAMIDNCEATIGFPIAGPLRSLLLRWNGISIDVELPRPMGGGPGRSSRFEIASTIVIPRLTIGVRSLFASVLADGGYTAAARGRASSIIVLSQHDGLISCQIPVRQLPPVGLPVYEFEFERFDTWLAKPERPIANDLNSYVEKSLDHMIHTGDTFLYWVLGSG